MEYRKDLLTREQIRSLAALAGWTWSPRDYVFEKGLTVLKSFVRRVGHAAVPHAHLEQGFKLGFWVAVKRLQHREGRLAPQRVRALENLPGWCWNWREERFQRGLERLRRFMAREKHARVPYSHREAGYPLGRWLDAVRRAYRKGTLPAERSRQLERLPRWTWHARDDRFDKGLQFLERFAAREGHALVPSAHVEQGFRLGLWVANRRSDHRRGKLSRARVKALEAVTGWAWNSRDAAFEAGYQMLRQFAQKRGLSQVPSDYSEQGFALGRWVHKLRQKRTRLPAQRVRRLEALPGWTWSPYQSRFERALGVLQTYARREGHTRVPAQHLESGFRLGSWVSHCRWRRASLSRNRRRVLEALPGWTWRARPGRLAGARSKAVGSGPLALGPPDAVPDSA